MSKTQKPFSNLNPFGQCAKYGIPLWQCPSFLFLIMGVIIIAVILATYFIASARLGNPQMVSLTVIVVSVILLVIDYVITRSFEEVSEASRMKTEFISIVSHQLRSPLTNLKFSLEILTQNNSANFSQKEKEYLDILKDNTKRMNILVNNLLMVSRLETGRMPFKTTSISVVDLIKKNVLKQKLYSEASKVRIKMKADKIVPAVETDPLWLEQIVTNLIDNGIRYSQSNGQLEIKIYSKPKKVIVSISDNGVGIPKEEQKYIFQKFFRSKNALKYQTEGSGLGLFIVKQIIELMGGKIWFKSEEGKGTTFFFSLPVKKFNKGQ